MSILSKPDLEKLLNEGIIAISSDCVKINPCSVDLRLGKYLYREKKGSSIVCPYDDEINTTIWEDQYEKYEIGEKVRIAPNEIILCSTIEFIGSRIKYTTMLKTKSTLSRLGLDCCGSAGWGDVGYISRWTFTLHNRSSHYIDLKIGSWVAQLIFLEVSSETQSYTNCGNYQMTDDITELVKNWKPEQMLPTTLKGKFN